MDRYTVPLLDSRLLHRLGSGSEPFTQPPERQVPSASLGCHRA
jgi:hypothetical protein